MHIIVLRHAEKTGLPDDTRLAPAGVVRADRLAQYIPGRFGRPVALIATAVTKQSSRPLDTLRPLEARLGLRIDTSFEREDHKLLAQALLTPGRFPTGLKVVCWHHGKLPTLIRALGAPAGSFPDPWPDEMFDRIIELAWAAPGHPAVTNHVQPF